jgi:copper chaperone CopZ
MTMEIAVEGMTCGGCEQSVEDALTNVEGVTGASADRETERATIEGDADTEELVSAVEDAGFSASA